MRMYIKVQMKMLIKILMMSQTNGKHNGNIIAKLI